MNEPEFTYLHVDPETGQPDLEKTAARFCKVHKNWNQKSAIGWIRIASKKAQDDYEDGLDFRYLFALARAFKAHLPLDQRGAKEASSLAPFALVFVEALTHYENLPYYEGLDWDDPEAVTLTFENVWDKAKFAEGENIMKEARRWASSIPDDWEGPKENKHLRTLVAMAEYLQRLVGHKPIQLPIHTLAPHMGVSPPFVSTVIERAVVGEWLSIVDPRYDREAKRAKLYRCNLTKLAGDFDPFASDDA